MKFNNKKEIKIGSIVQINDWNWYNNTLKDIYGYIRCDNIVFNQEMTMYLGKSYIVEEVNSSYGFTSYRLNGINFYWNELMFKVIKY